MDLSKGPPAPPPTVPDFPELAPQIAMSGDAAPNMDADFEKLYQAQSAANPQAVPQQAPAQAPITEPNMDADFEKLYQAQTAAVQSSGPLQPMPAAQVAANPGGTPAAVPQGAPAVPAGQTAIVPGTAAVKTDPATVAAIAAMNGAPKVGKITMGRGAKMVKPPPPVVPQNPLNPALKNFRQSLDTISPYLGQAIHTVSEQGKAIAKDFTHDPLGAAGAAAVGAPAGVLGLGDDLMRIAGILKKGEPGNKEHLLASDLGQLAKGHEGGEGLGELAGFLPVGGVEGIGAAGVKAFAKGLLEKGLAHAVENPEALNIIAKAAQTLPGKVKTTAKVAGNMAHGAAAGEAYGAIGTAGQDIKSGKNAHLSDALKGGIPTAIIGAGLGGASTALHGKGKSAPKDNIPAPPPLTPKDVALAAATGSIDKAALIKELKDPATPPERKAVILDQLKDARQIALGLKKAPEVKAPEPVAAPAPAEAPKGLSPREEYLRKIDEENAAGEQRRAQKYADAQHQKAIDSKNAAIDAEIAADRAKRPNEPLEPRQAPSLEPHGPADAQDWKKFEPYDAGYKPEIQDVPPELDNPWKSFNPEEGHGDWKSFNPEEYADPVRMTEKADNVKREALNAAETPAEVQAIKDAHAKAVAAIEAAPKPKKDAPSVTPEQAYTAALETPKPMEPRYISRPDPDPVKAKAGYHQVWDTVDNKQQSSSKREPADAARIAEGLNSGEISATQGIGDKYEETRPPHPERQKVEASGSPLADDAHPELVRRTQEVADAKHAMDDAEAKYNAMHEATLKMHDQPLVAKLGPAFTHDAAAEAAAVKSLHDAGQTGPIEVQNINKPTGVYTFKPGTTHADAIEAAMAQRTLWKNLERDYEAKREGLKPELQAAQAAGAAPRSINVPHEKGTINIREKDGYAQNEHAPMVEQVTHGVKQLEALKKDVPGTKAKAKRARGGRSQSGMINLGPRTKGAPPERVSAAALSMADGAEASSGIKALTNDLNAVKQIFNYRRTFDVARKVSHSLYDKLWDNVGKESMLGAGIKFSHDEEPLVHRAAGMSPEEIYTGQNGLEALSDDKLDYLATRNEARQDSAMHVKQALDIMKAEHGDHMPNAEKFDYEILSQLHDALIGKNASNGTSEFSQAGKLASAIMHDYIFKWNAGYHALNRLDPIMLGAARVQGNSWIPFHGSARIIAAQHLLTTDKSVRDFVGGYAQDSPIQQLRAESNAVNNQLLPNGVKPDLYHTAKGKIASLQSKLPDIPSERFNYQDSFAAGVIQHGDETGYGGTQLLKDLASGKLSEDAKLKTIVEGLKAANDITGTGSHGLDKSPLQRSPLLKSIVAFVEQPYRIARLQADLARQAVKGDKGAMASLATLAATTIMVGGRAALPKEMDLMEMNPVARPVLRAVQDVLDKGNIVNNVFGRDLVDKLRWGLVPLLGGTGTNVALEQMQGVIGDFAGGKWSHLGTASLLLALSSAIGGGGVEMGKAGSAYNGVTKPSEKKVNVYDDGPMPQKGGFPIKKKPFAEVAGHPYGIGDAIGDLALPGRSAAIGKLTKQARREKHDK